MLTSKQRATLRGIASTYETIFQVGKGGISDTLVQQVSDALRKRELIKMHVLDNCPLDAREAAQELAEKTGIAIEDLVVAMEAGREVDSFSRPVTENDGKVLTLEEKLEDNHRFETPLLNHIALKQAIDQLPEEEAQLIKFRYMDNLSQAETAKRMGKNQVSVSRSERKILEKLRRKML